MFCPSKVKNVHLGGEDFLSHQALSSTIKLRRTKGRDEVRRILSVEPQR